MVLMLIDDLGAEAIGCYGGESYLTPNIDALAERGMRFENAHAMPACMPSRVTLLTGRYAFRSYLPFNDTNWIRKTGWGKGEISFANLMKDQGYATAISGKWQLAEHGRYPEHLDQFGFTHQNPWGWWRDEVTTRRYWGPTFFRDHQWLEMGKDIYGPDEFCRYMIDFMREQTEAGKPFLAFYSMTLIHHPWPQTPDNAEVPQEGWSSEDNLLEHPHHKWSQANFDAMIRYTDKLVGRMSAAIDELGIGEDTLFILTADNGTISKVTSQYQGKAVRGGKMQLKESGTRVPFIAVWPGKIEPGSVNANLIDFSDVLPTLADLADAEVPQDRVIDGKSFLPQLLDEEDAPSREWVYARYGRESFVRSQDFRLSNDGVLHDMREDRYDPDQVAPDSSPEAAQAWKGLKAAFRSLDHPVGRNAGPPPRLSLE